MPAKIKMQIKNANSVFKSTAYIRTSINHPKTSNLGKLNLGSMPMIKRLSGAKTCGSCGH